MRRESSDGPTWSPDPQDKIERPYRLSYRWITGESLQIDAGNGRRAWWSPPFEVLAVLLCFLGLSIILIPGDLLFGTIMMTAGFAVAAGVIVWRVRTAPKGFLSIDLSAVSWKSCAKGLALLLLGLSLLVISFVHPTLGVRSQVLSFALGFTAALIGIVWVIVALHE